ncbi:MAG: hypothetical protein WC848_02825 [Parcubacteria group bacterium]|jgi:hypothetical protein
MTLERVSELEQAIPTIKRWDVVELMAFYGLKKQDICPLCGEPKGWGIVCMRCLGIYGSRGTALVMAEVGRKKVGIDERYLWFLYVGKNLSLLWGKRNGHNQKKVKKILMPIDDLPVPEERIIEAKVSEEKLPEIRNADVQINETVAVNAEPVVVVSVDENSAPEDVAFLPDRQIEIMPGMKIWHDIALTLAHGSIYERVSCSVCRGQKESNRWMCGNCFKEFREQGLVALKTYLAELNPRIYVYPDGSHIPDDKESEVIIKIAYNLLSSNFQGYVPGNPWELACTIRTLRGVHDKIPMAILANIAREALRRRAVKGQEDQVFVLRKQTSVSEKSELAESISVFSGMKNLKEDTNIAQAFLAFLSDAYYCWNIKEKANGGKPTKEKFAKKVGYNVASWHYLKYPKKYPGKSGISVAKAREIAVAMNTTLEEALAIGQTFLNKTV